MIRTTIYADRRNAGYVTNCPSRMPWQFNGQAHNLKCCNKCNFVIIVVCCASGLYSMFSCISNIFFSNLITILRSNTKKVKGIRMYPMLH